MAEPASVSAGGIVLVLKAINVTTLAMAIGSFLASVVVMCMMPPTNPKEWVVGIVSTVISSIAGGAWLLYKLDLIPLANSGPIGLAVLLGISFACGLPGWTCVRWIFNFLDKRSTHGIDQVAKEIADKVRGK